MSGKGKGEGAGPPVVVPLPTLLRRIVLGTHRPDTEFAVDTIFANMARLSAFDEDAKTLNSVSDEEIALDQTLAVRITRLVESLSGLGYTMPASGRVPVVFPGLASVLAFLEDEYGSVLSETREGLASHGTIPYLGASMAFPIGCIVTTRAAGGLGGTLTAFRVVDSYFSIQRSLLGGRKFSFTLVLEAVVALGGEFVSVRFTHVFEEWKNPVALTSLPFLLLSLCPHNAATELYQRAHIVKELGSASHAYTRYLPGSFFPSNKVGSAKGGGAATSATNRAAGGLVVVDTRRGLELGHSPARLVDAVGLSIAEVAKSFANVGRSLAATDSAERRAERLKAAGLTVWRDVPSSEDLILWPTVAAFSLTIKAWGCVLADGVSDIKADPSPWESLVLPPAMKEMLHAVVASALEPALGKAEPPRYRFTDVLDSRGVGSVFLLYGPPGTGKTLSVEALAAKFARPLYTVSFAELGTTVAELEERLTDVLSLAVRWSALVLLDEGDALIERRARGQLMLNSMTGVLLRLLETFDGALFLTSNRASAFDPAALSRVTLALHFNSLTPDAKAQVWRSSLARVVRTEAGITRSLKEAQAHVEATFDLGRLGEFEGSGRSIGAVLRLALALVESRGRVPLTQAVLDDALAVWRESQAGIAESAQVDMEDGH